MQFQATVVHGRSAPSVIELDADTLQDARAQATSQGYTVLDCTTQQPGWRDLLSWSGHPAAKLDVAVFIEQLRDLLVAGLSVIEALGALRRGAKGDSALLIEVLERELRSGNTLSTALSQQAAFPPLLVALVRSSEQTSDLAATLARFLEHARQVSEVRHRIVSASIYPLLLMGVGAVVLVFLFFYVMPKFARIFEGINGELPWSARLMVAWAHLLGQYSSILQVGLVAVSAALGLLVATPAVRENVGAAVLAWAPLRERLNTYFLARWYRAIGMLVAGGIPLPQALGLSNALLPLALRPAGQQVEQGVRSGLSPSAALVRAGMATPVAEQLLLAGERTGDLGAVLTRIAHFHESEVSRTLERTMRAVEPLVMVAIGVGVGLVVVLMYMPIFELASAIQ